LGTGACSAEDIGGVSAPGSEGEGSAVRHSPGPGCGPGPAAIYPGVATVAPISALWGDRVRFSRHLYSSKLCHIAPNKQTKFRTTSAGPDAGMRKPPPPGRSFADNDQGMGAKRPHGPCPSDGFWHRSWGVVAESHRGVRCFGRLSLSSTPTVLPHRTLTVLRRCWSPARVPVLGRGGVRTRCNTR